MVSRGFAWAWALLLPCACAASPVARLEQRLAAQESATAVLNQECAAGSHPTEVVATRVTGQDRLLPADMRALLQVAKAAPLGYRHVRLGCGGAVLSQAHNWFVPSRLPADMNATLATSDTPFGKVVAPLHFTRERLGSLRGQTEGCPAGTVLSQRGLLRLPDGRPISLVIECYQRAAVTPR